VRKRRAIDRLLPTIRATADPLTRDLYLSRAVEASGVSRALLERELEGEGRGDRSRAAPRTAPRREPPAAPGGPPPDDAGAPWIRNRQMELRGSERRGGFERRGRRERPQGANVTPETTSPALRNEQDLLRLMLHVRSQVDGVLERLEPRHFRHRCTQLLFRRFAELGADADVSAIAAGLHDDCVPLLQRLLADPGPTQEVDRTVTAAVNKLLARALVRRREELLASLRLAEGPDRERYAAEERQLKNQIQAIDPTLLLGGFKRST
jgi:DNA primase